MNNRVIDAMKYVERKQKRFNLICIILCSKFGDSCEAGVEIPTEFDYKELARDIVDELEKEGL